MILDLITDAQAEGLTLERACAVFGLAPRTIQRWRPPAPRVAGDPTPVATAVEGRARPHNALTVSEAAAVVALIRSPRHADASCRELALALLESPESTSISHVTVWQYQRQLNCNGSTAAYGKLRVDIVDNETGQPVTADITIRRERRDGSLVEDMQFFTGQKIEIEALVDPDALLYILVEAKGYHDWEISMRIKKASTLSAPIRLKPIAPGATPTPGEQG